MHVVHLLAVEAESHEDAIANVEANLNNESGDPWWDWYKIGGRWEGFLSEFGSEEPNVVSVGEKPEVARKALDWVRNAQLGAWNEVRGLMTGEAVSAEEAPESVLGFPIRDKEEWAQVTTADNVKSKAILDGILSKQDSLPNAFMGSGDPMAWLVPWRIGKGMQLIQGDWFSDSHFYDYTDYTARPDHLAQAIEAGEASGIYLVVVDFHF